MIPETSLSAYMSQTPEKLQSDYSRIYDALKLLKSGNYEDIAHAAGFNDRNSVSRRLKEMVEAGRIEMTGEKKPTERGRSAFVYRILQLPL